MNFSWFFSLVQLNVWLIFFLAFSKSSIYLLQCTLKGEHLFHLLALPNNPTSVILMCERSYVNIMRKYFYRLQVKNHSNWQQDRTAVNRQPGKGSNLHLHTYHPGDKNVLNKCSLLYKCNISVNKLCFLKMSNLVWAELQLSLSLSLFPSKI